MLRIHALGGLYLTSDGRLLASAAAQPRRLALLALLAVAGDRGVTGDTLLAYLWPDLDADHARLALTEAQYGLRRDLGSDEALLGMKDLRLNPDVVGSDLADFRDSVSAGDLERSADLWHGRFLDGFHLPGAETFERWVEDQRAALQDEYSDLLDQLAARAGARGDTRAAAGWLRRLGAISVPAPPPKAMPGPQDAPAAATDAAPKITPMPRASATGPRWAVRAAGVVVGAIIVTSGYQIGRALLAFGAVRTTVRVVAIGRITQGDAEHGQSLGDSLAVLLATNLARGAGLRVVTTASLEARDQPEGAGRDRGTAVALAVARRAGATDLVDGTLSVFTGHLRLELRSRDVASGAVRRVFTVLDADLHGLAARGTLELIRDLRAGVPSQLKDTTVRGPR